MIGDLGRLVAPRRGATTACPESPAVETPPVVDDLAGLHHAMRTLLAHPLGGRGLKSWELIGDLGRLVAPRRDDGVS